MHTEILKSHFFAAQDGSVSLEPYVDPGTQDRLEQWFKSAPPQAQIIPNFMDGQVAEGTSDVPDNEDIVYYSLSAFTSYMNLHKHKALHKHKHKHKHKGLVTRPFGGGAASIGLDWPDILHPIDEEHLLHQLRDKWTRLDLRPPATDEARVGQVDDLIMRQRKLLTADETPRRHDIVEQASNSLRAYFEPLGGYVGLEGSETAVLFQKIIWICGEIGLYYKANFAALRPSQLSAELSPHIPVPSHASYPSNHAFQSFAIARVFARAVPEHPGSLKLFEAAWKVAVNREYAGLHVRDDTEAGMTLARLCMPVLEDVLEAQMLRARADWV